MASRTPSIAVSLAYAAPFATGGERPCAPDRVPLVQAHLRAGDRRRGGPYAGRGLVAGKGLREKLKTGADTGAAGEVGKLLAERALAAGVKDVVFDRGRYLYHGRVKALADGAREGGLNF